MKLKMILSSLLAAGALTTCYVVSSQNVSTSAARDLADCCTPADQDWPTVSGNLGQQSYTSLSQITKANIGNLGPAWIVHVSAVPATTPTASPGTSNGGQQTSPIAVDGVVYSETPDGDVIAVDGATGAVKWKWHPTTANSGFGPTGTRRGLSVGGGRVYTLAAGNRVVALNKDTGAQIWAVVPTPPAGETTLGNIAKVATMYYNGKVYIGTNDGNRNAFFALDAATGAMAWTPFYGGARAGTTVTDVNGRTWYAGDTWMCTTDGSTPCPAGTPRIPARLPQAPRRGSTVRSIPRSTWSTLHSATCVAAARRRTVRHAPASTSFPTRWWRWTRRQAPTNGTSSRTRMASGTWTIPTIRRWPT